MVELTSTAEIAGVILGAFSGSMHAVARRADVIGVGMLSLSTGLGGSILRDVLIGHGTPLMLTRPYALPIVGAVVVATMLLAEWMGRVKGLLAYIDGLLLGVWAVMGIEKAAAHGLPPASAVFLGTVTATGGGVLRDVISGHVPSAFAKGELNAAAAFIGALTYGAVVFLAGLPKFAGELTTIAVAATLRLSALRWGWTAPEPADVSRGWRRLRARIRLARRRRPLRPRRV